MTWCPIIAVTGQVTALTPSSSRTPVGTHTALLENCTFWYNNYHLYSGYEANYLTELHTYNRLQEYSSSLFKLQWFIQKAWVTFACNSWMNHCNQITLASTLHIMSSSSPRIHVRVPFLSFHSVHMLQNYRPKWHGCVMWISLYISSHLPLEAFGFI